MGVDGSLVHSDSWLDNINFCNILNPTIEMMRVPIYSQSNFKVEWLFVRESFNIYKPQVQGALLSTWGVVHRELDFSYQSSLERINLGKSRGGEIKLNY